MPITDTRLIIQVNNAIQELMNEGDFPGVVDRWHVRAVDGNICLPPNMDRLMEFTADGVPQTIVSPWAEFVAYGPGPAEDILPRRGYGYGSAGRNWWGCGGENLYDRGEMAVQRQIPVSDGSCGCANIPVGPWVLRQYANSSVDELPYIYSTIQGLDTNGLMIRSQVQASDGTGMVWANGVRLGITSGSGYTETIQQFSMVQSFTKPQTNGYVRLTAWNGTDEIELANYEPWETTPSYHHYFSPMLAYTCNDIGGCNRVVLARCRRRFVPIAEDTDLLIIGNVQALVAMMIAQWKRTAGALDVYAAMKLTAVDLMRKESIAYTGKSRLPALTFQRGFSLGEMPALR